ncbi:HepT-like ribonuclease domain-containing protein [Methanoculleus sp.]|uniref:HepT-like ribonuclease domain-containing protein n=1 Tax=Methanoculleus sp. TaxID=90427 RepID=UPI002FC83032
MSREYNLYLRDILEAIGRIERYTRGMGYEEFLADDLVQDGVIPEHRRAPSVDAMPAPE